ncbi:MAG TPA: single-stranded DNA-binding protein [Gammaproteobacteria bacterium]|jgi:single-strand DNA-binding protein|nr:single-stranded DNA-binding protein [Gammaproteobacteria bacterium]
MINTALLVGYVGKKDTKTLKNGTEVTIISLATTKKYKDSTGQKQEQTTWHSISCFSKLSEIATKYVHVGDLVCIQGEIQNKKIETGERTGQYMYSIHANDIKFIPKIKAESKPNQGNVKQEDQFDNDDIAF